MPSWTQERIGEDLFLPASDRKPPHRAAGCAKAERKKRVGAESSAYHRMSWGRKQAVRVCRSRGAADRLHQAENKEGNLGWNMKDGDVKVVTRGYMCAFGADSHAQRARAGN